MKTAASSDAAVCFLGLRLIREPGTNHTNHLQSAQFGQTLRVATAGMPLIRGSAGKERSDDQE
jgi:hypothetical protein